MNVRIVPRDDPNRTFLYSVQEPPRTDDTGEHLIVTPTGRADLAFKLRIQTEVAEILLDDEPGDWW